MGILDLTRGERGTFGTPEIRAREAEEAAGALGVVGRWNAGFPDAAVDVREESRLRVAGIIRELRPAVVVTHWLEGRHPDHVATARLVVEASFLAGLKNLDCPGEAFRPRKVVHATLFHEDAPPPSFVIDVTDQVDREAPGARLLRVPAPGGEGAGRGVPGRRPPDRGAGAGPHGGVGLPDPPGLRGALLDSGVASRGLSRRAGRTDVLTGAANRPATGPKAVTGRDPLRTRDFEEKAPPARRLPTGDPDGAGVRAPALEQPRREPLPDLGGEVSHRLPRPEEDPHLRLFLHGRVGHEGKIVSLPDPLEHDLAPPEDRAMDGGSKAPGLAQRKGWERFERHDAEGTIRCAVTGPGEVSLTYCYAPWSGNPRVCT